MKNTLIVRYKRIGDGLIVLPLIIGLASKYPDDHFTVLTNARFMTLAEIMPPNVTLVPMITRKNTGFERGIVYSIRKKIFALRIKYFLKAFDKFAFLQYEPIEKKMYEYLVNKKKATHNIAITDETDFGSPERISYGKCRDNLTMIQLHQETLSKLGYTDVTPKVDATNIKNRDTSRLFKQFQIDPEKKLIAIAPFSKEEGKIYPLDKMEKVVALLSQTNKCHLLIMGGGSKEEKYAKMLMSKYKNVSSLINNLSFHDETTLLAQCDAALTMDSSNLHLAYLLEVPVVSIWGATLPGNGYYPQQAGLQYCISRNLPCQPCSAFGNMPCRHSTPYACMDISPLEIIERLASALSTEEFIWEKTISA